MINKWDFKMIFSKADKIPDGLDYDKTVSKLLKLGWLSEIFDVESTINLSNN